MGSFVYKEIQLHIPAPLLKNCVISEYIPYLGSRPVSSSVKWED